MNQHREDIDLIDLSLVLWRGKWIITTFISISVLIGFSYLFFTKDEIEEIKDPLYESKIIFSVDIIPTNKLESNYFNYNADIVIKDFQDLFYSKNSFQKWKNVNQQSQITIDDFSETKNVNGTIITKSEKIYIEAPIKERFIITRSGQIELLDEIFQYTNYISEILTLKYITSFEERYKLIDSKFKEFNRTYSDAASSEFIYELMKIDSFLADISEDTKFINILHLERPKNLNAPKPEKKFPIFNLVVFAIFGGMIGAIYVFIRNAIIRHYKN